MPVTQESFNNRDPRRMYKIRLTSGVYINDKAYPAGTVMNLSRGQAADILHGNKATLITDDSELEIPVVPTFAAPATDPAPEVIAAPVVAAAATTSSVKSAKKE